MAFAEPDVDLPRLCLRPSADDLATALARLELVPRIWNHSRHKSEDVRKEQRSAAATAHQRREETEFLSSIVRSPLAWIDDPDAQEEIWALASKRMTERCGRSALGEITRTWPFLDSAPSAESLSSTPFNLTIREPALTGDSLGHKTWGSSYLLAQHLPRLASTALFRLFDESLGRSRPRVLELGAGTGLLGLSAAALWRTHAVLTDLEGIVPNLAFNAAQNREVIEGRGGGVDVGVLEWGGHVDEHVVEADSGCSDYMSGGNSGNPGAGGYEIVLVADGLYNDDGPKLLANTIREHLARSPDARLVMMAPQRDANAGRLLGDFRHHLESGGDGLECVQEEWLAVEDDWQGQDDEDEDDRVACWLGIYAWKRVDGQLSP